MNKAMALLTRLPQASTPERHVPPIAKKMGVIRLLCFALRPSCFGRYLSGIAGSQLSILGPPKDCQLVVGNRFGSNVGIGNTYSVWSIGI